MHGCVQDKNKSDGTLEKLKLIIVVRGDVQNKEMVGYTWSPTASIRTLKYFLAHATKHKARIHRLYFIAAFLQAKVKNIIFFKLNIRYKYFSVICKVLWKSLEIIEVHVWHD